MQHINLLYVAFLGFDTYADRDAGPYYTAIPLDFGRDEFIGVVAVFITLLMVFSLSRVSYFFIVKRKNIYRGSDGSFQFVIYVGICREIWFVGRIYGRDCYVCNSSSCISL